MRNQQQYRDRYDDEDRHGSERQYREGSSREGYGFGFGRSERGDAHDDRPRGWDDRQGEGRRHDDCDYRNARHDEAQQGGGRHRAEDARGREDGWRGGERDDNRYGFDRERETRTGSDWGSGIYARGDREGSSQAGGARQPEGGGKFRGKGPKGYTRSDERIREDLCDRLSDDDLLDASDISVSVSDGEVTLDGKVGDRRAKRQAEDIADGCSGVKHVQNNLRVKDSQTETGSDRSASSASGDDGAADRNRAKSA